MPEENQVDRELTFGEKAVGLTFNPSGDDKVGQTKKSFANLAKDAQDYQKIIGSIEGYKETYDATEVLNKLLKEKKEWKIRKLKDKIFIRS